MRNPTPADAATAAAILEDADRGARIDPATLGAAAATVDAYQAGIVEAKLETAAKP